MGQVIALLDGEPFDPEMVEIMCTAFDRACAHMDDSPGSRLAKEIIAKRIIGKAKTGERDVTSLINHGLFNIDVLAGNLEREHG